MTFVTHDVFQEKSHEISSELRDWLSSGDPYCVSMSTWNGERNKRAQNLHSKSMKNRLFGDKQSAFGEIEEKVEEGNGKRFQHIHTKKSLHGSNH